MRAAKAVLADVKTILRNIGYRKTRVIVRESIRGGGYIVMEQANG